MPGVWSNPSHMKATVTKKLFGQTHTGKRVDLFTLTNAQGLCAKITNYGTIITELWVPDREGRLGNIVLGFDNLRQYLAGNPSYLGCTVGRVANRTARGRSNSTARSTNWPSTTVRTISTVAPEASTRLCGRPRL